MISEIVRSKANIDSGAESSWANCFHGIFLLAAIVLFSGVLSHLPIAALAAILVYVGTRLASIQEFLRIKSIGHEQAIAFLVTLYIHSLYRRARRCYAGASHILRHHSCNR